MTLPGVASRAVFRYWAFISYNSSDAPTARWLQRRIELTSILKEAVSDKLPAGLSRNRLFPVFRDRADMSAAPSLQSEIETALASSYYLIVVCSPAAAQSEWVNKEVAYFISLGRRDRILALIVDGSPEAVGETACFPAELRALEPLAADLRPSGDGREVALNKILSGMLGVSLDALLRRDAQRKLRSLQVLSGVGLAALAGVAGLAVYVRSEQQRADQKRDQAERVLEYLVYDLTDELRRAGRPELADMVRREVDAYYREIGPDPEDLVALANRATAYSNAGHRALDNEDLSEAIEAFRLAQAIRERLAAQEPQNTDWLYLLAVSYAEIGGALDRQGDAPEALRAYASSTAILKRSGEVLADPLWLHQVSASLSASGFIQARSGAASEAIESFHAAREPAEQLLLHDATEPRWLDDVALTRFGEAEALVDLGRFVEALDAYMECIRIWRDLVLRDPNNVEWLEKTGDAHVGLAGAYSSLDLRQPALDALRGALSLAEFEAAGDPNRSSSQIRLLAALINLAALEATYGDEGASNTVARAASLRAQIESRGVAIDPPLLRLLEELEDATSPWPATRSAQR